MIHVDVIDWFKKVRKIWAGSDKLSGFQLAPASRGVPIVRIVRPHDPNALACRGPIDRIGINRTDVNDATSCR